jgi:ribosomal protein L11 methyltransferase
LREAPAIEAVPQADWVSLTQKGLAPVQAGHFFVHGSHDRGRIASQWAIEIDAGRAFGTAHHASTKGCLIAIDGLARMRGRKIKRILDLGTGSGILAIAAVKALAHRGSVLATDIDPAAVEVASLNSIRNGVRPYVTLKVANGVPPGGTKGQPFDLVIANILAKPLIALAEEIRAALRPGGSVILGGFLEGQAREVIGAYLAKGFAKTRVITLDGWATAVLRRIH